MVRYVTLRDYINQQNEEVNEMLQKLDMMYLNGKSRAEAKLRDFLQSEKGDVNIVSIVVIIGIVIIIAGIFRNQIKSLIESLFQTIGQNAQNAIK